ncbi:hypothetical protein 1013_scaffold3125_00039 [Bacteriophage sp.]|nr:hypothetical protein 1013_scaffold3125_00039 [Bacteriophage sp.]
MIPCRSRCHEEIRMFEPVQQRVRTLSRNCFLVDREESFL